MIVLGQFSLRPTMNILKPLIVSLSLLRNGGRILGMSWTSSRCSRDIKNYHSLCSIKMSNLSTTQQESFLSPITPFIMLYCGLKVKGRVNRRCKDCYFVVREERLYVMCKTHPRHKQVIITKREKNTWILTHASQSVVRPW